MVDYRAKVYRQNADDCRAQEARDPTQKEAWLKLADEWLRLALLERTIADLAPPGEPDDETSLFERQVAGEFNVYTLEKRRHTASIDGRLTALLKVPVLNGSRADFGRLCDYE